VAVPLSESPGTPFPVLRGVVLIILIFRIIFLEDSYLDIRVSLNVSDPLESLAFL
jgi:hypothetical protein